MANLAVVGSHSTNGVAAIHSGLLRTVTVRDLAEMFPERFNNNAALPAARHAVGFHAHSSLRAAFQASSGRKARPLSRPP
jgi:hypothetical protein